MFLQSLKLVHFKNHEAMEQVFSPGLNVLTGRNGSGKTNVLDAIYYLAFTKNAFQTPDLHLIHRGQDYFYIQGSFLGNRDSNEVSCSLQRGAGKIFSENGKEYQKLSEHIGKYPTVMISPDDTDLGREGGESRRRFFDGLISQIDRMYLDALIRYNQVLRQRNGLLRMLGSSGSMDRQLLDIYDQELSVHGKTIFEKRLHFVDRYIPVFIKYYNFLVDGEVPGLTYESVASSGDLLGILTKNRQKDMALQRTTQGVHRDHYRFTFDQGDLKVYASQGQLKSFIIALKLAQWKFIQEIKGIKPLLLLDDIFDKLDDGRIEKLVDLLASGFGQIFITDARPDRTRFFLDQKNLSARIIVMEKGTPGQGTNG